MKIWEELDNTSSRLRVPGGWVIRFWNSVGNSFGNGVSTSVCMLYIADVEHEWKIVKE